VEEDLEFTRVDRALIEQAAAVMQLAKAKRLSIVTAESCTGGLIAAVLSEAPGAGDLLHGGFVAYTKDTKIAALGVPAELIEQHGLVSEAVARAMVQGALERSPADLGIAITGVAGPEPDEDGTPVGTVHLAAKRRDGPTLHVQRQFGDIGRGACRYRGVEEALALLRQIANAEQTPRK
jgi:nicotinamide-nucleotide amidase